MIGIRINKYCCDDISLIENYDKAIADETQTWHCHHRLETDMNVSIQYLIDNNLYYNRPASELIFLTCSEHTKLHRAGYVFSKEHKESISKANKGKILSKEHRENISKANKGKNKGKILSKEHKESISKLLKAKIIQCMVKNNLTRLEKNNLKKERNILKHIQYGIKD